MSDEFIRNAQGVLSSEAIDQSLRMMWEMDKQPDIHALMALLSTGSKA